MIEKIVMNRIRLENDRSIHRQNRVIIVVNEIVVIHRQIENTKNHEDAARAAAVIVVATHVIRTVHANIQNGNVHRLMIA